VKEAFTQFFLQILLNLSFDTCNRIKFSNLSSEVLLHLTILSAEMSKNVLQVRHTGRMADSYTVLLYYTLTSENGVVYNTKGSHSMAIPFIESSSNKTGSIHMTLTSRCVCATITGVEKHQVLRIRSTYSLTHPACNVHAPYHHLWPAWLYNIFFTLSHKRHDIRNKNILNIKCVFLNFLYNCCLKHFSF